MIDSGSQSIAYDFQAGKNRDPSPCFFRGIKQNNEDAIDPSEMKCKFASRFIFNRERYLGNAAYSPVLNSMIFRGPLKLKPSYTPPLLLLESLISPLQCKLFSCFVDRQWRKKLRIGALKSS